MVFRARQTILAPVGLVTQPNAYGIYPDGALKRADNVTMRNPGELVQMPGTQAQQTWTDANHTLQRLFALDAGHVFSITNSGTAWQTRENGNVATRPTLFSDTNLYSATGRISPVRSRERMLLNTLQGYSVVDVMAPTSAADRTQRLAGMPQPQMFDLSSTTTNAMVIASQVLVGYAACFVRNFADGYILRSVPTPVYRYLNTTGVTVNLILSFAWLSNQGMLAGDVLELYRTDGQTTSSLIADPGQTLKRVLSYTLTAADIAAQLVQLTDTQTFLVGTLTTPGNELYTNPYQEGPTYSNRQPPIAACTAAFKGFTFFGRTTDRAKLEFSVPGGIGNQFTANNFFGVPTTFFKTNSIGRRTGAGTITNGSNVITAVSAADLVGVKIGQRFPGSSPFPLNTAVTAVGASTITMSANATAGGASWTLDDVIEINGVVFVYSDRGIASLFWSLTSLLAAWEVSANASIAAGASNAIYQTGITVRIEPQRFATITTQQITVRATNGANYSPVLPEFTATVKTISGDVLKSHLVWSKEQQPEHVPAAQETFVGNSEIITMNPTRDANWVWCTDGLYRLSGSGGSDGLGWGLDLVSTTLILAAPGASAVLGELVFGYTNQGFVSVDSAGNIDYLTDQRIGNLLPGAQYTETRRIICEANETDDEVLLGLGENGNTFSDVIWVWNVKQRGFTNIKSTASTLKNITAMNMQRSTASGEPRLLFGVSPLGGGSPSYSGWNASTFLDCAAEYQPVYSNDPLSLKQYIWVDYIFASGSNAKTLVPLYNSTLTGQTTITDFQNSGYARAGVPRQVAVANSISVGFEQLSGAGAQSRFQGISIALNTRTNQSKKR